MINKDFLSCIILTINKDFYPILYYDQQRFSSCIILWSTKIFFYPVLYYDQQRFFILYYIMISKDFLCCIILCSTKICILYYIMFNKDLYPVLHYDQQRFVSCITLWSTKIFTRIQRVPLAWVRIAEWRTVDAQD